MQLRWTLFFLLIFKPIAIVVISQNFTAPPELTPVEREDFYNRSVRRLLNQHHTLTDIKLIYTRFPKEHQDQYDNPLITLHQLYKKAVYILERLDNANENQWKALCDQFKATSRQIELNQSALKERMNLPSSGWVYHI